MQDTSYIGMNCYNIRLTENHSVDDTVKPAE